MLFNSYAFVFLFLPLCMLGFYMIKKTEKAAYVKAFLVLMSLWFYAFVSPANLPVLLISIAVNFGVIYGMQRAEKRKPFLVAGLIISIGTLFFFKYTGQTFVPLAISFFTFSQIAFMMEVYHGNLNKTGLLDYSFYITFFPKMVQGPIALPQEMEGQVEKTINRPFDWEGFYRSLCLFVLGLSKKVLLADTLGSAVNYGYENLSALHTKEAWVVILAYTLQLYFDFSGYSDMAMGTAGMLGFSLPVNFASPYKAANIVEFWKGWHISLTRFFTKYLYIPLGGNRKGKVRAYVNMLLVFFISGIWHGAGVTFIIWGLMHGVLYVITKWMQDVRKTKETQLHSSNPLFCGIKKGISVIATFLYVNVAWVFFRASSVGDAITLLKKAVSFTGGRVSKNLAECFNLDEFWYVIKVFGIDSWQYAHYILMVVLLIVALIIVFFAKTAFHISSEIKPGIMVTIVFAVLFVWCVVTFSQVSSFLYVNF